ncbi:hypothetical protein ABZ249_25350 [Nocardiopsis sp. NPDC006139]|uniref:hypothetical protein n=1 Tax=Nocardiopsis sp. NPDC006139 TaxID=3154578 RepID=UPI0033B51E19
MNRRISRYVHVAGLRLEPGDMPSPAIADQVTNPKAWGDAVEAAEMPVRRPAGPAPTRDPGTDPEQEGDGAPREEDTDPEETVEDDAQGDDSEGHGEEVPQRPAENASTDAWRAYILATVDVSEAELEGKSRADLIAMDAEAVED